MFQNPIDTIALARLLPVEVVEYKIRFATCVPVTFKYVRNTEAAGFYGPTYQQDIEPAGRYMLHNPSPGQLARGWEAGTVGFTCPLVVAFAPEGVHYGPESWKARLRDFYGKKGAALTRALRKDGFDGIVTVAVYGGHAIDTREIVDLRGVR